jgi:structural maintenance of chromosome 1
MARVVQGLGVIIRQQYHYNMPVTVLEIENFKSYGGSHVIGPFSGQLTCVIGPNGSGKSNLMDAISFVLGVQSAQLRSQQLLDLIHRPAAASQAASSKKLKCRVTLVYEKNANDEDDEEDSVMSEVDNGSDGGDSSSDEDRDEREKRRRRGRRPVARNRHASTAAASSTTLRFGRGISTSGVGEYYFQQSRVSWEVYEQELAAIHVLVKARNFLVFQGDVESLARKTPAELCAVLEQVSGSIDCKANYDAAVLRKVQCEEALLHHVKQLKSLKLDRKQYKEQKEEMERFQLLQEERRATQCDLYLWLLYHLDQDRLEREQALHTLQAAVAEATAVEEEAAAALRATKKRAATLRREVQEVESQRLQAATLVDQHDPAFWQTTAEIESLQKKLGADQKQLEQKQKDIVTHQDRLARIQQEIVDYRQTAKNLDQEWAKLKQTFAAESGGMASIQLTTEQEEEYERVKEAAAAAAVLPKREWTKAKHAAATAQNSLGNLQRNLDSHATQQAEVARDVQSLTDRRETLLQVRRSRCGWW